MWTCYIWLEPGFIAEGIYHILEFVQPTVRTLMSEKRTPVEKNDQKSTFLDVFEKFKDFSDELST